MASEQPIRQILAAIERLGDRIDKQSELTREQQERLSRDSRDQLQFTREVIRRNEIAFLDARRESAENVSAIRDMRDEIRAQTGALLALIDEIRGRGPATA